MSKFNISIWTWGQMCPNKVIKIENLGKYTRLCFSFVNDLTSNAWKLLQYNYTVVHVIGVNNISTSIRMDGEVT